MRPAALMLAIAGAAAVAVLAILSLPSALDGWRAAFLLLEAPPVGAVALLLVARVTGADWDAALMPLLPAVPWLVLLAVPVVIGQALLHWPADHLHLWLSPPAFALRTLVALSFWAWIARALRRGTLRQAGPVLLAHGVIVSAMSYDWLLGAAPDQPNSAAPMILATMQIAGACALACAARLGEARQRRDLGYLLVAAALGLAYLLYMDFAIIWFGDLPEHVGWYRARLGLPASLLPGAALALGLVAPILLIGVGADERARRIAGASLLAALGLVAVWQVAGAAGWLALVAALAATLAAAALARSVTA